MPIYTVTNGISSINGVTFDVGDTINWSPSQSQQTTLAYSRVNAKIWHADLSWDASNNRYTGNPSFQTSDYLIITIDASNELNAAIFSSNSPPDDLVGDGEVGSWTADEDPPPEG